ncbi:MAG: ATP-binding protein [Verrucomicrobia bacterium]|nr:ATP-binding protein [Verrucomicrobiota bacterium]
MHPRFITAKITAALADTRVVLINGPRQSGKTTLARGLAGDGRPFFTLDDSTTLDAARRDPVAFVRGLDHAVIDEVQRAPDILLAIKRSVDEDRRPGRFLLTGSANLMTLPRVADSLAGRMATLDLLPLSPAEVRGTPSRFLDEAFKGRAPQSRVNITGADLVATVLAGGYPEALRRATPARRQQWHLDYVRAIVQRDVRDLAQIDRLGQMPRLLRMLAHHSGQLINYSSLGAPLALTHVTTQKYAGLFEQLYLIRTLPPWFTNELKRLIKTPKLTFLDSGLLASLRGLTAAKIAADRRPFGALLETFVLAEALKLASWEDEPFEFFHFRDKERNEVDVVIENSDGRLIGLEVKAAATVGSDDFGGLRKLAAAAGKRFAGGFVLYDHDQIVPFGDRLFAAPISSLWA